MKAATLRLASSSPGEKNGGGASCGKDRLSMAAGVVSDRGAGRISFRAIAPKDNQRFW